MVPLQLEHVSRSFGALPALDDVSLTLDRGITALIGPSGCGKSTLVRMCCGLDRPDRGQVLFEGENLADANLAEVRRKLGYVIQEGGLFPHLTVRGNVTLAARCLRWTAGRIRARLDELAALVQLDPDLMDRFPRELSGGQRQRASLMRALMLDPDVLLLDEPLGALDPLIRHRLQNELRAIFTSLGTTVVLITHDLYEASTLADRIVLMRNGRVVQEGDLEQLRRQPANDFVREFLSAHRMAADA
ncbi:MAG: ATP-binding cassette domain-containing protein [Wenzhouxiangellaceae bacterium]